jgi:hypothetical protein
VRILASLVRSASASASASVSVLALIAAVLLAEGPARAQASPRSAPVGGRSALMGGTGVALARDGAAPFLNPATIIHIDDSGLAFSVNFYTAQWANLSGFHQPGAGAGPALPNTSLDTTRADALPSTLCLFLTIGDWGDNRAKTEQTEAPGHRKGRRKLAACLAQPERSQFSATAVGYTGQAGSLGASQGTSVQRSWNRLYVGPSYSVYVSDRVALGAALNGIGTTASSTWGIDTLFTQGAGAGSASAYDTGMTAYSVDLNAVLGLVWHIDDVQVLGASVSTPSVHVLGNYNGTAAVQTQGPGGQSASLATSSGNFSAPVPVRVAAGFGVQTDRLRIEGDASAYLPVTYLARADVQTQLTSLGHGSTTSASFPSATQMDGWPVVDVGLGLEYFLSRRFSLLTGASTDMSELAPLPARPAVGTLAETRMQRVTTSIGIGSYGDGSELLLGTELSYAWGKSIALDPYGEAPQLALVDQRTYQVMLIIAGSASISAFRRTLKDLGEVVKFPPAR